MAPLKPDGDTMGKIKTTQQKLTKSKERVKELGEVFTPDALVTEMLSKLPAGSWEHAQTFLEPSCGNGNFLVQILERKLAAGATPLQALSTIHGVDIMEDNADESRARLLAIVHPLLDDWGKATANLIVWCNIVCGDILKITTGELFCSSREQRALRHFVPHGSLFFQAGGTVQSGIVEEFMGPAPTSAGRLARAAEESAHLDRLLADEEDTSRLSPMEAALLQHLAKHPGDSAMRKLAPRLLTGSAARKAWASL